MYVLKQNVMMMMMIMMMMCCCIFTLVRSNKRLGMPHHYLSRMALWTWSVSFCSPDSDSDADFNDMLLCDMDAVVMGACKSLADTVRAKSALERNNDEKEWISVDRVMFPDKYMDISGQLLLRMTPSSVTFTVMSSCSCCVVNALRPRFADEDRDVYATDPFYQCSYSQRDIARVSQMSPDLLTALSQIKSPSDLRLHFLLSKYLFGQGEEVTRLFDQDSGSDAVAIAAIQRGELVRMKPLDDLTTDEADWMFLDRIVRPEYYVRKLPPDNVCGTRYRSAHFLATRCL